MRLFVQIERTLGYQLPPDLIFQAPTLENFAQIIRQGDSAGEWPTAVAIQPQGDRPPLSLAHGSGGGILGYAKLARLLGPEQPVFGLQGRGMDSVEEPHTTIEEMAAYYVAAMRTAQASGPYYLGGYCFGYETIWPAGTTSCGSASGTGAASPGGS